MTKFRPLPSRERLIELFEYNQKEGALYWRQRHNSQIDICKPAGWLQQNGYHGIRADGASYKRHRIVWCYFNGDPGELEIDHINGIKNDDRIENLRLATQSQKELVEWLRNMVNTALGGIDELNAGRAADLLQRQAAPVPVASDVYFEFVVSDADYCTQAGGIAPSYAQALSEGQRYLAQYQQDGPHTLELRRVEVLPLPGGEVEA